MKYLSLLYILMLSCLLELFVETGSYYKAQVYLNATILLLKLLCSGNTDIYTVNYCSFILTENGLSQLPTETVLSYILDTSKGSLVSHVPLWLCLYVKVKCLLFLIKFLLINFIGICIDVIHIQSFKWYSLLILILTFPHYLRWGSSEWCSLIG